MTKEIQQRDPALLEQKLADLNLTVAQAADGLLTVCSGSEPRFCYDVTSIEEAERLTRKTLSSYARNFYGVDIKVNINFPRSDEIIPIETARAVSRAHASVELLAA